MSEPNDQSAGHKNLAEWLEAELQKRGLTQIQLAESTGVAAATVHGILRKGHIPRIDTLFRIGDYLGVDRVEMMILAGHLRRADQLPRGELHHAPLPPAEQRPQQDTLTWQLLQEFRRIPDEWKPEAIAQLRLFQRLAKHLPGSGS
jgi:transcriptional regulator with XRE-family HTH domain